MNSAKIWARGGGQITLTPEYSIPSSSNARLAATLYTPVLQQAQLMHSSMQSALILSFEPFVLEPWKKE